MKNQETFQDIYDIYVRALALPVNKIQALKVFDRKVKNPPTRWYKIRKPNNNYNKFTYHIFPSHKTPSQTTPILKTPSQFQKWSQKCPSSSRLEDTDFYFF